METNTGSSDLTQQIQKIFEAHKKHQHVVKQTTADERTEKLKKFRQTVLRYKDEISNALYNDFQRPKTVTYGAEIGALLLHIDYTVSNLKDWLKREPVFPAYPPEIPYKAEIVYEPKGVVLIMGPWNGPLLLTLYPLIAAVAAGNTAIVKPSELTPRTSSLIKKIIEESFDKNEVTTVEGGVNETTELLRLPFDHIYFTGSTKVAKIVMEAASKNLTSVTLELGGKAPSIIHESADMEKAVYRIMKAKAFNAGQICINTDYVLIPEKLQDNFVQLANAYLKAAYQTQGDFNYDDYEQIINEANYARVKRLFDDAVANGAKVAAGGVFEEKLRKIQPTVLTNVSTESSIMKEEIFGPLLPLVTYSTKEEAIKIISNIEKPLGLYIFSNDSEFTEYIIGNTTSGGVTVNDVMTQGSDPALPFGGVNNSGIGKGYGKQSFLELTNARVVVYQSPDAPNDEFFKAPYAGKEEIVAKNLK